MKNVFEYDKEMHAQSTPTEPLANVSVCIFAMCLFYARNFIFYSAKTFLSAGVQIANWFCVNEARSRFFSLFSYDLIFMVTATIFLSPYVLAFSSSFGLSFFFHFNALVDRANTILFFLK